MKHALEINQDFVNPDTTIQGEGISIVMCPPVDEDFWVFRVPVSDKQAIVGFPKFFTIGIGFQVEEDWNTNLPYTCPAERIYEHIVHNKGDDSISKQDCIKAIEMIQATANQFNEEQESWLRGKES